jgi:hypothetical protein
MTTRNLAFLFSFFNLAGVFPLLGLAGVYRPNRYDEWISSVQEVPLMHSLSGILFTIGVFCGVALGSFLMIHHKERFWTGLFLATGSTLNGLTTMFPFILAQMTFDKEIGIVMLATALLADSAYNLFLGMAMIAEGMILKAGEHTKLGWAGIIIGFITIPVASQCIIEEGALWLGIAGPSWIMWWALWGYRSSKTLHAK